MNVNKILFFILLIIALLASLSKAFPYSGVEILSHRLFFPSLEEVMIREKSVSAAEKVQALEQSMRIQFYQDSLQTAKDRAYQDTLRFYTDFFKAHPSRISLPENDFSFFKAFFDKLDKAEKNNELIHILHYGDSQIEGDRITGFFRQKMQEKFGGQGVGLIPLVQPIPSASVGQTASENIERFTIAGNHINKANHQRYGVLGQTANVYDWGQVSVSTRNWKNTFENVKSFSKVRVFVHQNMPGFAVSLSAHDKTLNPRNIDDAKESTTILTWDFATPIKRFAVDFIGTGEVGAVSLDGKSGVTVDNIPLRGSSGTFFTGINSASLSPVLKELNVQLIILQFGGNVMPGLKSDKQIEDYKNRMAKQINFLQKIRPEAKILLIGPSDMSVKIDGRLQTYPLLSKLANALKEAAVENGAAFWNMFEVMGGENSMIEWVNNKPALATPDYVHFTPKGSDKIAELLFETLMIYYNYYYFITNPVHAEFSFE